MDPCAVCPTGTELVGAAADSAWTGNLNQEAPSALEPTFLCARRDHQAEPISELVRINMSTVLSPLTQSAAD